MHGHTNYIYCMAVHGDMYVCGRALCCGVSTAALPRLATGSKDSTVRLWDLHTGECMSVLETAWNRPSSISSLILNNEYVMAGTYDGKHTCVDICLVGQRDSFAQ
jgi:WD40 repeat protein